MILTGTTLEMNRKGIKLKNGFRAFRRYQALDDALCIFFHLQDSKAWLGTTDIIELMEWNHNHATRKRVRRIGESLVRVGRVQTRRVHGGSKQYAERIWRILE